jgi:hypothetical protein
MANRENHYEAAFEAWLRERQIAYVAVDERRRSLLAGGSLKSLDFIVTPTGGPSWLVDIKGRRFPSGATPHYWKNWSTRDDLISLARWETLFGAGFRGLFVFAFQVVGERAPLAAEQLFEFSGALYGFVGVRLSDYAQFARLISPRWDTLAMHSARFRQSATPVDELFGLGPVESPATASASG